MAVHTNSANARTDAATPMTSVASTISPPGSVARAGRQPVQWARPYANTAAMNAGSTITSRDSHDVRQRAIARQPRSGRPRWKNDAARPRPAATSATSEPVA